MQTEGFKLKNLINAEASNKNTRNAGIVLENKATAGDQITCTR